LLEEGTNLNYGARHLKRAIERLVVHPMSNLIATEQIVDGDAILIDHHRGLATMNFSIEGENLHFPEMTRLTSLHAAQLPAACIAVSAEC
jgi:hypothetical protein